jgi:hypothetical protein
MTGFQGCPRRDYKEDPLTPRGGIREVFDIIFYTPPSGPGAKKFYNLSDVKIVKGNSDFYRL